MKLAIVTGASSGIGAATARKLVEQGYQVVMIARSRDKLEKLAQLLGDCAHVEVLDASDGLAVLEMAERIKRDLGVPDVVVNSAGAGQWKFIENTTPEEAIEMMNAPYFAAFNVVHAFMRDMLERDRGVIINVLSPISIITVPGCVGYAGARWALRGLHESLCDDLSGTNVKSCGVYFGLVESEYFENNPGVTEHIPKSSKMIPTISVERAGDVILKAIKKPRRQYVCPFMLRVFLWSHSWFPWLSRFLVRRTGAKRV